MRFRRSRRSGTHPGYRIASRIILLAAICVAGSTLLRWNSITPATKRQQNPDSALPPSPFADLGQDVFLAQPADVATEEPVKTEQSSLEIDTALLSRVLDKTKGIPGRPYFHLIDVASRTSPEALRDQAVGEDQIGYANLWNQPEKHRGDAVLLKGHLHKLVKFQVSNDKGINPSGLSVLYEGALVTEASQPYPYIIIVTDVPERIQLGGQISENVTFAGYFLKLWRYKSATEVDRAAPLMIGRLVSWTPGPKVDTGVELRRSITLVVMVGVLAIGALIWASRMWKARSAGDATEDTTDPSVVKSKLANLEQSYDAPSPFVGLDHTDPPT